jgi:hypothetical protein
LTELAGYPLELRGRGGTAEGSAIGTLRVYEERAAADRERLSSDEVTAVKSRDVV